MDLEEIVKIKEITKQTNTANRFLKLLWLIPMLVLGYIGWINLVPLGGTITYFIDAGGEDTNGRARITGPFDRISDKKETNGISFRELERDLVYFELDDRRLSYADEVRINISFKDNFPGDAKFILGARNKEEWSYYWKESYVPFYEELVDLPLVAGDERVQVYAMGNKGKTSFQSVDEFLQNPPLGSVVATNNKGLSINQRISQEEFGTIDVSEFVARNIFPISLAGDVDKNGYFETDTSLRGMHTFYFFSDDDAFELKIAKRDLNWYEGEDMLDVIIYSLDGTLKAMAAVPDDGDSTKSRNLGNPQYQTLKADNLERGTYRLVLKPVGESDDFVITHLELNKRKVVTEKGVFLAGNIYLKKETMPMEIWCYLYKESEIKFLTWHKPALQIVTISGKDDGQTIDIDAVNTSYGTTTLNPGVYRITSTKGDLIIEAPDGYFAFTEDSVFIPASSLNREENGSLLINTALRGGHTFWTYVRNDSLELEITKQDLNWYEKPDELKIEVYSLDGGLMGATFIPDDGNETKGKELGPLQSKSLIVEDLEQGAYRIWLKGGGDLRIRRIEINQEKLVANEVFLEETNPAYFKGGLAFAPVRLYGKNFTTSKLKFHTWHDHGLQQINIEGDNVDTEVDVDEVNTDFTASLKPGAYQLTAPKQDIIIKSSGYLSFTPDSFFLPKRCEVIDLKYDLSWALQNADYIIVDYKDYLPPVEDDGYLVAQAKWKREDLFTKDNKLSFCLSAPHLGKEPGKVISIDWIEITVKTLSIWERLGWLD